MMVERSHASRGDAIGVQPQAILARTPGSGRGIRAAVQGGAFDRQDEGSGIGLLAVRKIEWRTGPAGCLLSKTTDRG
jgi:hypothetical protein